MWVSYRVFIKYLVFFLQILEYSGLWPFSVFPRWCQCVYTQQAGITSAAAELAEFRKIRNFKEKNTIFNEHQVA